MVRAIARYLSSQPRLREEKACLTALLNTSRFIDDIGVAGFPAGRDIKALFDSEDHRSNGGPDGIYPISIIDKDGSIVANPMELKHEHGGLVTHYLDLQISIGEQGSFHSTVYQKRDDMPVFHDYIQTLPTHELSDV